MVGRVGVEPTTARYSRARSNTESPKRHPAARVGSFFGSVRAGWRNSITASDASRATRRSGSGLAHFVLGLGVKLR